MAAFSTLGPHASFILAAYGLGFLTVGGLIAWIVVDHRRQTALLADLAARGVSRRSASGPREPARKEGAP